jgi:hypothetical protein
MTASPIPNAICGAPWRLAYRGGKLPRRAASFAAFGGDDSPRTPRGSSRTSATCSTGRFLCRGKRVWKDSEPLTWDAEVERFHEALARLDAELAAGTPLGCPEEKLFQGPIADALTHVGQLAMLRRLSGAPIRGENYFQADIAAGRVGPDQAAPRREF